MGLVGILYIAFENNIRSAGTNARRPLTLNSISSSVLGVQVGLIILAMFVTRSSVTSIQSKQGLPLGKRWGVLGLIVDRPSEFRHDQ